LADDEHDQHDHGDDDAHDHVEHDHGDDHPHEHDQHVRGDDDPRGHDQQGQGHADDPEPAEATGPETAIDSMLEAIRQAKVEQLVVSSISTFASVAYAKLEAGDLPQARAAIDVIGALLPFLVGEEETIRRDFDQALTNLKLAYANAVPQAQ
jgi:hypothetical protein